MKTKELIKNIKGVFLLPVKKYYLGSIKYYTPYFEPMGFHSSIISFRKLKRLSEERLASINSFGRLKRLSEENRKRGYGWAKEKYSNMPMVRRSKNFIVKIFGNEYYVRVGRPWAVVRNELGWKDKYNSPRYEWEPSFQVWFFKWQFCIHWTAPEVEGTRHPDLYFEMILWYLKYYKEYGSDKPDIALAEKGWGWVDGETKKSTWNKDYLV